LSGTFPGGDYTELSLEGSEEFSGRGKESLLSTGLAKELWAEPGGVKQQAMSEEPILQEAEARRIVSPYKVRETMSQNKTQNERAGGMAQVVQVQGPALTL
jgi:hypothetical protein